MRHPTVPIYAFFVLALLGTPVVMHVVMHDLHDHQDEHASAYTGGQSGHSDHEHPIVATSARLVPRLAGPVLPLVAAPTSVSVVRTQIARSERNVVSFGALRMADDVGLQPLLSTFLI